MTLIHRVGTFFILLGIGLIVMFILSDIANQPSCGLLIWGGFFLVSGMFMWFRDPPKPGQPPERFRSVKRMFAKKPDKK